MLIGEVSIKTGFSRDTIRYYEKYGLIHSGRKERRLNNYKEYSEKTLLRLLSIKKMKSYGFTLNDISQMLELIDTDEASCNKLESKVIENISLIDQKIKELKNVKKLLSKSINHCISCCGDVNTLQQNCLVLVSEFTSPVGIK